MSKFEEALENYTKEMKGTLKMKSVDADLLRAVTKACGPSIYNRDASTVSCSDQSELDRVKKNFLIKKLSLTYPRIELIIVLNRTLRTKIEKEKQENQRSNVS